LTARAAQVRGRSRHAHVARAAPWAILRAARLLAEAAIAHRSLRGAVLTDPAAETAGVVLEAPDARYTCAAAEAVLRPARPPSALSELTRGPRRATLALVAGDPAGERVLAAAADVSLAAALAVGRAARRLAAKPTALTGLTHQPDVRAVLALLAREPARGVVDAADADVAKAAPSAVLRTAGGLTFTQAAGEGGLAHGPLRRAVLALLARAPARVGLGASDAEVADAAAAARAGAAPGAGALMRGRVARETLRRAVLARL